MVTLRMACPEDAAALAEISRRAFDNDALWGRPGTGGPPGYDSAVWQARAMRWGRYLAIIADDCLVGGIIVIPHDSGHYELGRIFVDPTRHRQGIGREAMRLVEAAYPFATTWSLDTPAWNTRTPAFYASAGYTCMGSTPNGSLIFEKRPASTDSGEG